jgi:outer membrane protein OmpA-like peptidoglycan-associated protein
VRKTDPTLSPSLLIAAFAHAGALLALVLGTTPARGQDLTDRLKVRAMLGGALMVSHSQTRYMGYDAFGLIAGAQVGYAVLPWLEPQVAVMGAGFPRSGRGTGGLLVPMVGVTASVPWPDVRPYVQLELGPGYTGSVVRAFFRAGIGVDFRITRAFALGPVLGYGDLYQPDAPGNSTDARFGWLCVSVAFRPGALRSQEPAAPRTLIRTVVLQPPGTSHPEPAPAPAPSPQLLQLMEETVPRPQIELLAPVLFEFDSDALQPVGVAMLHEVARELARRPDIELLEIQGYADQRGNDEYNEKLSARRAQRVLEWLVEHGVARERLQVAAKGASEPVEAGENEAQYEQNRRVVFRVLKTKAAEPK